MASPRLKTASSSNHLLRYSPSTSYRDIYGENSFRALTTPLTVSEITPYEALHGRQPNVSNLRALGYQAWYLIPS
ncbi:GAG-pre-integrase domain-containing protein [Penicillium maclennaniae]|uniref:GAG-pre-integrase domain-containing protein n=1 Tax=Penicillium maclennaniae TaxID=1343394 RepID=UPI002541C703|nr:GAG-pre-integrase domain-containing protein [Penicillium maclennaniae]KAJ5677662.1 GAG-pre-integrase domain-containing protein [Penicillium maclennaniae]